MQLCLSTFSSRPLAHNRTMFWLAQYNVLLLLLLCSGHDSTLPLSFDIRIDYYKADTIRDLIINTPRPQFSWKVTVINHVSERNNKQIAYRYELQSCTRSNVDRQCEYDTGYIRSAQLANVRYAGYHDLLPATNYCFRLRILFTTSEQPTAWTDWIRFRTSIFHLHDYVTKKANLVWIGLTKISINQLRKQFSGAKC